MSKRGAASELTHDNWNDEDEPEEAGTFRKASNADLAVRKIRTAKRRGDNSAASPGGGTSIFKEMSGFANFGAKTDTSSAPSFSFFNNDSSKSSSNAAPTYSFGKTDSEPKKSTFGAAVETKSATTFGFNSINTNGTSESTKPKEKEAAPKVNGFESNKKTDIGEKKTNSPFMAELKSLNETFLKWIKQHLDENMYVNLTPVLEDYQKYFQKLSDKNAAHVNSSDKKEESNEKENKPVSNNLKSEPVTSGDSETTEKASEAPKPAFSFLSKSDDSEKPAFTFGSTKTDASKPLSIFGNDSNSSNSGSSGVKFGSAAPLTFGGATDSSKPFSFGGFATAPVPTPATKEKTDEENEDEPPKVVVNEVKEDDAIYEKKCKLFYMKDKEYVERGLGTIFLKKAEEKTQLIVRANTNLGNILLNIIVGPSIGAMMRVGKNNVMIVCIPNPPIDPKSDNKTPVKMLLRVKTSEDADALLKILEEHKAGK